MMLVGECLSATRGLPILSTNYDGRFVLAPLAFSPIWALHLTPLQLVLMYQAVADRIRYAGGDC